MLSVVRGWTISAASNGSSNQAHVSSGASRNASISTLISALLYFLEFASVIILLAFYKKEDRSLSAFLPTPAGRVLVLGACGFGAAILLLLLVLRVPRRRQQFLATLALNVGVLALLFVVAEVTLRALTTQRPAGQFFGETVLLPKSWAREAARNRAILREADTRPPFLISDPELGWTLRPSAHSRDYNLEFELSYLKKLGQSSLRDKQGTAGPRVATSDDSIYSSSVEGLRSPRAGMSFAATRPRHRIALIGDSFTFGLEVRYEETWGHQLELALGRDYQVLNFGVDGYGADQALLRYRRDVVRWHPDIVILGLISDDMHRTMCVYAFLCFPGAQIPFWKPRFIVDGDSLRLLTRPAIAPDSLFATQRINQLPIIEYDHDFEPYDWDWHAYDRSYAIRYLLSRYRRWSPRRKSVDDAALATVNIAIVRSFEREVRDAGAMPVVLFFPARSELSPDWRSPIVGRDVLLQSGVSFIDMTPCVTRLAPEDRYVAVHFSPAANAAIARCLRQALPASILQQEFRTESRGTEKSHSRP